MLKSLENPVQLTTAEFRYRLNLSINWWSLLFRRKYSQLNITSVAGRLL